MSKLSSARTNEKGSVLIEAAIVTPLYIFFVAAVFYLGQLVSQLTWVSQATYHAAYAAAESPPSSRAERVAQIQQSLVLIQNESYQFLPFIDPQLAVATDDTQRTVTVTFSSTLNLAFLQGLVGILGVPPLRISFSSVAPLLTGNVETNIEDAFRNPPVLQQCCVDQGDTGFPPGRCVECTNHSTCRLEPRCS